ncbi:hypothetical protein H6G52_04475 [Limnothrix sp. FACHB-881]|uniref:hypothetical protein n=1 Tax=Limnothrix sp. FACHB-881 TaxID=2692819 RepID=UPI001685C652|nr:hypothetical protein [Limnothrix sp. FACHB-881]MBD2634608.1 hypothetical protein [Limnothrix sp. FACHB-881]
MAVVNWIDRTDPPTDLEASFFPGWLLLDAIHEFGECVEPRKFGTAFHRILPSRFAPQNFVRQDFAPLFKKRLLEEFLKNLQEGSASFEPQPRPKFPAAATHRRSRDSAGDDGLIETTSSIV